MLATCYKIAKQFGQAKDCFIKASDCYKENRALFHAARCYEQVYKKKTLLLSIKFHINLNAFN